MHSISQKKTTDYWFPFLSIEDEKLPLHVYTIGIDDYPPVNQGDQFEIYRKHGISHRQIILTMSGKGIATFDEEKKEAVYGTLMYHSPNTPHIYQSSIEGWKNYWITYAQSDSFNLLNFKTGIYPIAEPDFFLNLCKEMTETTRDFNFIINTSSILYKLLIYLNKTITSPNKFTLNSVLSPAIDYINKNYTQPIELKELAALCFVTPEYFCRHFMANYKMRPFEYIQHLRIQDAKSKLQTSPTSTVAEISKMIGYENTSYFIEVFKKNVGVTPHVYKAKHTAGTTINVRKDQM